MYKLQNTIQKTIQNKKETQIMLIKDRFGKDVTNENRNDYVLEYTNTKEYIADYGTEQYEYIQELFKTTETLDTICRYMCYIRNENDERFDDVEGGYHFVVQIKGKYLLLDLDTEEITELEYDNIDDVHKYVFSLY